MSKKISQLPAFSGSPAGAQIPVALNGVTSRLPAPLSYPVELFLVSTSGDPELNAARLQVAMTTISSLGGGVLQFGPGTYPVTLAPGASITWSDGVTVRGAGIHDTTLDFSGKANFNSSVGMIRMIGSGRTLGVSVTATVPLGSTYCIVSSVTGYTPGDIVQLRSTETYVIDDGGTRAEFLRVRYVDASASRVYFTTPTQEPYDIGLGTVTLGKITFATGGWSDMTIKGKGSNPLGWPTYDPPTYGQWTGTAEVNDALQANRGDYGIECIWGRDLVFRNLRFVDVENQTIFLQSCFGGVVEGCSFEFNSIRERSQYGVALYRGTSNVRIANNFCINCRHFVTTGSTASTSQDYFFGVPHNCTVTSNVVLGSWQSGIDLHRSGHSFTIVGNVIQGYFAGIKTRAARVVISNNVCIGPNATEAQADYDGIQVFYNATDVLVTGNKIYGHTAGIRVDTPDADYENLVITNNVINDCASYGIRVDSGAFVGRRIKVDGNLIKNHTNYGISLDGAFQDVSVNGNTVHSTQANTYGIRTTGSGTREGLSVSNNILRGHTLDSIYLDGWSNVTVSANQCHGGNTNGVHLRVVDCKRGTVAANHVELPAGATGGTGIFISATGSGTCQDLAIDANQVYAHTSVGTGIGFSAQADQHHTVGATNNCRTCATPVAQSTEVTIRNDVFIRNSATIAAGVVTAPRGSRRSLIVDTEGAAATDDLDTVSYGGREGDLLTLRAASAARDVVVKDGTGNMRTAGDCTLASDNDSIMLEWRGSVWVEVCRSING
jgi:acetyltransferase-like isoleucine patch superfamily enzyme